MRPALLATALLAAAGAGSSSAIAAEPSAADRETSRALYAQGIAALDAHDYPAAERACGGARALVKAPTSAACWARALEGLGRLVEARDVFLEAARFPTAPDEPSVFTVARAASRVEANALEKRIPTVTLVVSGPSPSAPLHVTIDGANVPAETTRLPRKVNPGARSIVVSARGFEPTTVDVQVAEAEDRRVEVALPPISPGEAAGSQAQAEAPRASAQGAHRVPLLAIVGGGVGVAGLVVGAATALAATSRHSTLQGECNGSVCPPSAEGDLDSFRTLRTASAVGYVVGGLGIVGGAVIWYFAPSRSSDTSARVWLGPGSAGLAGAF